MPDLTDRQEVRVRKLVTVLFADLAGSTSMGETIDAEALRDLMLRYFDETRSAVERHGGVVEKFVGDAVVAVFGVPVAHEDDALRALRAAVEVRERLGSLNDELDRRFGARLMLRIGVNSGEVVAAGEAAVEETFVTGDAVNVAARLEQAAEPDEILVGERTFELARGAIRAEAIEPLDVKGKAESVNAYRLHEVSAAGPVRAARTSRLVGRREELAELESLFDRAVRERRAIPGTILGEPGVGKTRLASELASRLPDQARVFSGRCLPYGEGITFWPLVELVREAAGIRDEDTLEQARGRLQEIAPPEVADPVASAIGLSDEPSEREAIDVAFRRLFETLALERPLVAVIEDLHWAEPTLLELLLYSLERAEAPILLVSTARPELLETCPEWPVGLRLAPLSETEIDALLIVAGIDGPTRKKVVGAAGGNPLFAEELAALLREHPDDATVPTTLNALLTARLELLPEGERKAAERGSIEGQVFHRGAVIALSEEGDREKVRACLESLHARDLVQPARAEYSTEVAFRFRHVLIRDAAYARVPKKLRAELHERFARWLEERAVESAPEEELVGYHLEQAVRYRRELGRLEDEELAREASSLLALAGRRAQAREDASAAANLLDRAASLLEEPDQELLLELGEALRDSGELARAKTTLKEAIERAAAAGDDRTAARARIEQAYVRIFTDPGFGVSQLLRIAEETVDVLERHGDDGGLARAWQLAADANWFRCWVSEMTEAFERALVHARRDGALRPLVEIYRGLLRTAYAGPMPVDAGLAMCERLLGEAPPVRTLEASAAGMVGLLEGMRGRFDEARASCEAGIELLEELGKPLSAAVLRAWAGLVELDAGDPVRAEAHLRASYDAFGARGETGNLSSVAAFLAEALHEQGRLDEAERLTEISAASCSEDDVHSQVGWRSARALICVSRGELEAAELLARDAEALSAEMDYPIMEAKAQLSLGRVLLAAGQTDEAVAVLQRVLATYDSKGYTVAAARARELLAIPTAAPPT